MKWQVAACLHHTIYPNDFQLMKSKKLVSLLNMDNLSYNESIRMKENKECRAQNTRFIVASRDGAVSTGFWTGRTIMAKRRD
jgi:hypothetical protein